MVADEDLECWKIIKKSEDLKETDLAVSVSIQRK
jgi:hypothetical protein